MIRDLRPRNIAVLLGLACAPAFAQPATAGAGNGWLWGGSLLALLLGLSLGYVFGMRGQRTARQLNKQLDEYREVQQRQADRLVAARRENDALIERLQKQHDTFDAQAHLDGLTGLPNGRAFDEALAQNFSRSKRNGQPLCLVMLDIDRLQQINKDWSHVTGDSVLAEVGKLLRSVCRTSDLSARLGGDGFALLLTDTDQDGGWRLCQRLHEAFAKHRNWQADGEGPNYVTFSAGLSQLNAQDQTPAQFYQRTDRALYLAKNAGGARTNLG